MNICVLVVGWLVSSYISSSAHLKIQILSSAISRAISINCVIFKAIKWTEKVEDTFRVIMW